MADVTVKNLDEFEAIYRGAFRRVRAGLGLTAFGVAVFDLPPNFAQYPEHDHGEDGQEELYTALSGSATLATDGEEHRLEPGVFARVGPNESRKLTTDEQGALVLVLGGVPGATFSPKRFTEEGEPDPLAAEEAKGG
jgi:quercetin dioxygenase-like cupin family protein